MTGDSLETNCRPNHFEDTLTLFCVDLRPALIWANNLGRQAAVLKRGCRKLSHKICPYDRNRHPLVSQVEAGHKRDSEYISFWLNIVAKLTLHTNLKGRCQELSEVAHLVAAPASWP